MMLIGICDDEKIFRENIKTKLNSYLNRLDEKAEIKEFSSGDELLESKEMLDLLFLDIEMKGKSGIEVKNELFKKSIPTIIVFMTSYVERMKESFGLNVGGFIEKQVDDKEMIKTIRPLIDSIKQKTKIIVIEDGKQKILQNLQDICYIKVKDKYSELVEKDKTISIRKPLCYFEDILNPKYFCRVNRSTIVNIIHVKRVDEFVELDFGKKLSISRRNKKLVKDTYMNYMLE